MLIGTPVDPKIDKALIGFSTLCGSMLIGTACMLIPAGVGCTSFSTLCGSMLIGTYAPSAGPLGSSKFQYPLRVDVDWNTTLKTTAKKMHRFQYPLRVDVDWNQKLFQRAETVYMFQYPLRVDVDWNVQREGGLRFTTYAFQYPLRVDADWNAEYWRGLLLPISFSTLCGSMLIGTDRGVYPRKPAFEFQYPLRVDADWNLPRYIRAI